jgi:hypothetical protein
LPKADKVGGSGSGRVDRVEHKVYLKTSHNRLKIADPPDDRYAGYPPV